jgi:hypothetical protein
VRPEVKAKATPKTAEYFGPPGLIPAPSLTNHLIWPTLDFEEASGGEADYQVTNPQGLAAQTLWSGFERDGRLVARYLLVVPGYSMVSVSPQTVFLASVGEGGHWETTSDRQLLGSRAGSAGQGLTLGLGVEAERLHNRWSYPGMWLGLGGSLWVVNPGPEPATVAMAVMREGNVVRAETLTIPPQGGMIWPESSSGSYRLPAALAAGTTVIIHSLNGPLASGLAR